ncbi:hypothetical protein FXB38_38565 [Bradyrhizobium cytisi]|uniref:Uncharacterized protein n=1 Tax=Bradyrhizobium cytisi TaxID=515489 RepID=A0A5S4W1X0_9BRAD|nr:hypothetical protein FXB38_38565 [Bradyrhizobium cytisi]
MQNRHLESIYPLVFFDALRATMRETGIKNEEVLLMLGKHVLRL